MTRTERTANLAGVVVPFAGVLAAIVLLWNRAVNGIDLAILAAMYLITAVGITVGFHRLLTHRAFQTHPWLERVFAVMGSLAVQGSVLDWVADHRKHHAHADQEGDPHSPHVGHGTGLRGLWHAHTGWLLETQGQADWKRYASELYEDQKIKRIGRRFPLLVVLSLAIPTLAGFVLHGFTLGGALRGYIWGGLLRIFLVHHVTWSVNSICHFFGRRRFDIEDQSTNVAWLALFSLGESWHHNHHAFPRSAYHGLRRWEIDLSGLFISALARLGLAWNVVRITPERQLQKAVAAGMSSKDRPLVGQRVQRQARDRGNARRTPASVLHVTASEASNWLPVATEHPADRQAASAQAAEEVRLADIAVKGEQLGEPEPSRKPARRAPIADDLPGGARGLDCGRLLVPTSPAAGQCFR